MGYRLVLGRFILYNLRKSAYKKGRAEVDGVSASVMRNRLLGGCANGPRIACGASPLEGRRHHSLVTPIDWKLPVMAPLSPKNKKVTTRW